MQHMASNRTQEMIAQIFDSPWTAVPAVLFLAGGAIFSIASGFYLTYQLVVTIGARL